MYRLALTACSFYLRHTPIGKGRWRLTQTLLPLLRESAGPTGTRWIRTRRGFKIEVDLRDWIGQHIYVTGDYEPAIANLIGSLVHEGDIVVDVGANIGFHTLALSRRIAPSGKVIAFEPMPPTCAILRRNLTANGIVNAEVHEVALSDCPGTTLMYEGPVRNRGNASMRALDNSSATRVVRMSSFDRLVVDSKPIALVKIDVEGAEQLVLQGMIEHLRRDRPHIVVEVSRNYLRQLGFSEVSLCSLLLDLGYRMYDITEQRPLPTRWDPAGWPDQFNALFSVEAL